MNRRTWWLRAIGLGLILFVVYMGLATTVRGHRVKVDTVGLLDPVPFTSGTTSTQAATDTVFLPLVSRPLLSTAIGWPKSGSVVNGGTLVLAQVPGSIAPEDVASVVFGYAPVSATLFSAGGTEFQPITGVAPDGLADPSVLWNTFDLSGGDYVLLVQLQTTEGTVQSDTLQVHVNEQPVVQAQAQPAPSAPGLAVEFIAESFDNDGSVDLYQWDFGDGTTIEGPDAQIQHTYENTGTYGMSVTAVDDDGGSSTGHYILNVSQGAAGVQVNQQPKDQCGCKNMTVKTSGAVEGPNGFEFRENTSGIPNTEGDTLGAYNDGENGDQLDMTETNFTLKYRFEVIAELEDHSKPQLCTEGQRVKRTATFGGNEYIKRGNTTSDPRYDSSVGPDDPYDDTDDTKATEQDECPYGGAPWCDDDYHGGGSEDGSGRDGNQPTNGYKRYVGQEKIVWLDAPGITNLARGNLPFEYKAQFEARVSGELGSCECSWEVRIRVDDEGKVLENTLDSVNCS